MRKKGWKVINVQPSATSSQPGGKDGQGKKPPNRSGEVEKSGGHINFFIRKIPLLGSVIKIQRPSAIPSEKALDQLAQKNRALFIKIEPNNSNQLSANSFQLDSWPLLPTKTLRLDLTRTEEELWNGLDSDAKYSIRKAENQLSTYSIQLSALEKEKEKEKELRKFHRLLKDAGKRQCFPTPSWRDLKNLAECFGDKGWLITAGTEESQPRKTPEVFPAAGCIMLTHAKTAYYYHAATTKEGRDLLAGYLVLWEAINLAKKQGCTTFDFEGIYDERYHKRTKAWKGFTYFKKKFGGEEIIYPKPIIKYYSRLFQALDKIFN